MSTKYPRTPHLPWSPAIEGESDALVFDIKNFLGKPVVVTEKLDGECTMINRFICHARSLDGYGREEWQAYVMNLQAKLITKLPEDINFYAENMYAVHSIEYDKLASYIYGFAVESRGQFLSWGDTTHWWFILGMRGVPFYKGFMVSKDEKEAIAQLKKITPVANVGKETEGFVVRSMLQFPKSEFDKNVAKLVRANHIKTEKHWRTTWHKASLIERSMSPGR